MTRPSGDSRRPEDIAGQARRLGGGTRTALLYALSRRGFLSEFNILIYHYAYALSVGEDMYINDSEWTVRWGDVFEPYLPSSAELDRSSYDQVTMSGSRLDRREWNFRRGCMMRACDSNDVIDLPAIAFRGRWRDLMFHLINRFFQPLPQIRADAQAHLVSLGLTSGPFGAIHIRRGDKTEGYAAPKGMRVIEGEVVDLGSYISALEGISPGLRRIFVLTDDYREILNARERYPYLDFVTLCDPGEHGYDNIDFKSQGRGQRVRAIRRLIMELLIAIRSSAFAGGYLSNVSRTVVALHPRKEVCRSVDSQLEWAPGMTRAVVVQPR
jgi:hypothetical protein